MFVASYYFWIVSKDITATTTDIFRKRKKISAHHPNTLSKSLPLFPLSHLAPSINGGLKISETEGSGALSAPALGHCLVPFLLVPLPYSSGQSCQQGQPGKTPHTEAKTSNGVGHVTNFPSNGLIAHGCKVHQDPGVLSRDRLRDLQMNEWMNEWMNEKNMWHFQSQYLKPLSG